MTDWNPDYLARDRRQAAQDATRRVRADAIRHRARLELGAALASTQEAMRTAGVVLAVLLVIDVYRAPLWIICGLFFAPLAWNGAVLLLAMVLARRRA